MRAGLTLTLALGLAAPSVASADEWDDDASKVQLALRHNDRPLSMPHDVFDIFVDGGFAQLSSQFVAASLGVGARYGVDDHLEVGLRVIRLTMSEAPDTGLGRPTVFSMYRLDAGPFEAAVRLEAEVPTSSGALQFWLQFPMLARIGPYARLDARPTISTLTSEVWQWAGSVPVEVSVQITDRLRAFGAVEVGSPDLRRADALLLRAGGGVAWVFGNPSFEIAARVDAPSVALIGERSRDPAPANYFGGVVTLRLFFQGPAEDPNEALF